MAESNEFKTSNQFIVYRIVTTQTGQDILSNTSWRTVEVQFRRTNKYTDKETQGNGTVYCTINNLPYQSTGHKLIKNGGDWTPLFSQNVSVSHENDGSKSIWIEARINIPTIISSSTQGFTAVLPKIPRFATFADADNFTDEQNPRIWFSNPAKFKIQLKMEAGGDDHLIVRDNIVSPASVTSPYKFELTETERNKLRALCPNSNTLTIRFTVGTYMPGSTTVSGHSWGDRKMTVTNANPTFTKDQLDYKDTNAAITAITGNDQLIVRNQSTIECTFTAATARKYATMNNYQTVWNGITTARSTAGTYSLGAINSAQDLTLQVKANDSRSNSTTISKTVTILDWVPPIINATAERINNFENETILTPNVQISSVNSFNSIELLQYRAKKTTETAWGSWFDVPNSQSQIVLNNLFAWDLEIQCSDKFGNSTKALYVPKGMPILYFDTDKLSIGVNCFPKYEDSFEVNEKTIWDLVYPINSIYYSTVNVNPGTIFTGTTWVSVTNAGDHKWRRSG